MALSSDPFDSTELVALLPYIWSPIVNEALFAKTVFANFCKDFSAFGDAGGTRIYVPDAYTNVFTGQTQSTQATEVTTEAPATVATYIDIDTHKYVAFLVGDKDLVQIGKQYDGMAVFAREAANTISDAFEDSIAALWSSISTNTVGDTATYLSDAEIRQAVNKLDSTNYDLLDCAFFFHPYVYWNQIHALAKYYTSSTIGGGADPVYRGTFGAANPGIGNRGTLYGIPIYLTSNVVSGLQTYRNMLLHKSAIGYAIQTPGGSRARVQVQNWLANIANLTVVDMVYGVKLVREPGAVLLNASNSYLNS